MLIAGPAARGFPPSPPRTRHAAITFMNLRTYPIRQSAVSFVNLWRFIERKGAKRQRTKPPPGRLVVPQGLKIWRRGSADFLLQCVDQRVKLMTARRPVPLGKIDVILSPKANRQGAGFDLDRHKNLQLMRKVYFLCYPTRRHRFGAPQHHQGFCLSYPTINLQSEIAALDELIVKPDRKAIAIQDRSQMLSRAPALALIRYENFGHSGRSAGTQAMVARTHIALWRPTK